MFENISSYDIYLLAATLRPETIYAQTNCWVLPHDKDGKDVMYGCYRSHVANELFIVGDHAARNMAFQGLSPSFGVSECVARIRGQDLLGLRVASPISRLGELRIFPLLNIFMDKGTGIVACVPSVSPEDHIALRDLEAKPKFRAKYGIEDSWIEGLRSDTVIMAPYKKDKGGDKEEEEEKCECIAERACEEFKVASQNDRNSLEMAKIKAYKISLNDGSMTAGPFAGQRVKDVKNLIRDQFIAENLAYDFSEPESKVRIRRWLICLT